MPWFYHRQHLDGYNIISACGIFWYPIWFYKGLGFKVQGLGVLGLRFRA